jgi:distribution and morphology protein 12
LTPPSIADPSSRPPSQHYDTSHDPSDIDFATADEDRFDSRIETTKPRQTRERNPEDVQIVSHVKYNGNLKLTLTTEILLDYPMPSFVGIPLKLNITGLTFDGVAIIAYIRKRAHFCFLSPEDADALVGRQDDISNGNEEPAQQPMGGLLEEIRVESEIGDKDNGGQVLKNVGKVERFVLEQVRRIFEDEFVYPSFWTFLV